MVWVKIAVSVRLCWKAFFFLQNTSKANFSAMRKNIKKTACYYMSHALLESHLLCKVFESDTSIFSIFSKAVTQHNYASEIFLGQIVSVSLAVSQLHQLQVNSG